MILATSMVVGCLTTSLTPNVYATEKEKTEVTLAKEEKSLDVVYVSPNGNDESGKGTKDSPVGSLLKAVSIAKDGATVYVMDNLTIDNSVRVVNKTLTINGQGHTVKRGDIKPVQDNARSTYNPAMFEVNNWDGNTSHHVLTFKNITLDDNFKAAGSDYSQQSTDKSYKNENKVQDAIVASYTTNDIVLDEGTVLSNYGGMSAVRVTADANLIMKNGSKIIDTKTVERGHKNQSISKTGQAGAVWMQGGNIQMQPGSYIGSKETQMIGRGIYADGGHASINGTILNIKQSNSMWFGGEGVAIHVRNYANVVLEENGKIDTINGVTENHYAAVRTNGKDNKTGKYSFETKKGSVITNITGFPALFSSYGRELLNGTIENCSNDYIIGGFVLNITIGKTGVIKNCEAKVGAAKTIVYTSNASKVFMNGTIKDNDASYAFYIINHSGGESSLEMNDGAKVIGNGKNTGVYVNASGSSFTMNGGEITNFGTGVYCRGKENGRSGKFFMNGGTITNNNLYGLNFSCYSGSKSKVELNGGKIENNGSYEIYLSNGKAEDLYEHMKIKSGVVGSDRSIGLPVGTMNLEENYSDIQIGNAKKEAVDKIKELVGSDEKYKGWQVVGNKAIWIKPSSEKLSFKLSHPYSAKKTDLFVTYIPLKEDGTPAGDAKLMAMDEVAKFGTMDVELKGLKPDTPYAVMFVNNDVYTLNPDDNVKYIGGGTGDKLYVGGFPVYSLSNSLDNINSLEIDGVDTKLSGDKALEKLKEYLTITYVDKDGKKIENDSVPGKYSAKLSLKDGSENVKIRINGNEIKFGDEGGTLVIRDVSDKNAAVLGNITYPLIDKAPEKPVEHGVAIAKKSIFGSKIFYVNGDDNRRVENASGIALLDDELISLGEKDNSKKLLENKGKKHLGINDKLGTKTNFDFHYLDLVDTINGNVWVTAANGATVYLPYPEGTNSDTDFNLIRYNGLNRDYTSNAQSNLKDEINNSQVETIKFEKTEVGIKFDIDKSGFGPFALVWSEEVGTSTVTVKYIDKETNNELKPSTEMELTVSEEYDVTDKTNVDIEGYHIDSVDGNAVGTMTKDGIVVKVYYLNDEPIINAEDVEIKLGDEFDPLKNIDAKDTEDGEITDNIKVVENDVDTSKEGKYKVTYEVTDKGGKTITKTIEVTVVKDKEPTPPVDKDDQPGDKDHNKKPDNDSKKPNKDANVSKDGKDVKTGDTFDIMDYVVIMALSLGAIGALLYKKKKSQN